MAEQPPDNTDEPRFRAAPGTFPTANVPVWVTMHPECDEGCLAIAQFITAYRNSSDGTLPFVERSTVMKRFGKKKDWLDRRTATLERIGFLSRVAVYRDTLTNERTIETHAENGAPNKQTSNDWMLHDDPPAGDAHPHPIQSSEVGRPGRIEARVRERGRLAALVTRGGAHQRRGSEQGKLESPQVNPQALTSAGGGRSPAPGGGAHQRPELEPRELEPREPTNHGDELDSPASVTDQSSDVGWLDDRKSKPITAGQVDPDGARLLRSLPFGVGPQIAGHVVDAWSHTVGAVLRSGIDESVVIDKLTSGLPGDSLDSRVRIVVGHRLKNLKVTVEHAPSQAAERESAEEQAHAKINRWAQRGVAGARQAAGLIGKVFDPESQRGNLSAQEWLTVRQPEIAREFLEEHRADLVAALTARHVA